MYLPVALELLGLYAAGCRGGVCSVHPDREATLQCTVCLRLRVAQHLSYHCSVECLKSHWHLHKEYHTPKDEVETIDFEHLRDATAAGFEAVRLVADGTITPLWLEGMQPKPRKR